MTDPSSPPVSPKTDTVEPDGPWRFDETVVEVFDDMLARSIPQYDLMRSTVTSLAVSSLPVRDGTLIDLGASNGNATAEILAIAPNVRTAHLWDISDPMLAAARERFANDRRVRCERVDLRHDWPSAEPVDVVLSVLTLQFVPIEYRQAILDRAYRNLRDGGTLIVVEKVLGSAAQIDRTFVDLYLESKRHAGYSWEQIDRKRLSLEGVLVPLTATMNEQLLLGAGFRKVDVFWRWLNFAGWIAVR
jgi:tRNA (cmo5U34)-methyltransferase